MPAPIDYAFVFDIDGVLRYGRGNPVEGASKTIEFLSENKIPYVFLTNGGGSERYKEEELREELSLSDSIVKKGHIVGSATALFEYAQFFKNEPILVVGGADSVENANSIGLSKAVFCEDVSKQIPDLIPRFTRSDVFCDHCKVEKISNPILLDENVQFKAVFVLADPLNWLTAIEPVTSILTTSGYCHASAVSKLMEDRKSFAASPATCFDPSNPECPFYIPPIFFANSDFTFAGKYPTPRLTMRSLRMCISSITEERMKETFTTFITNETQQVVKGFGSSIESTKSFSEWILRSKIESFASPLIIQTGKPHTENFHGALCRLRSLYPKATSSSPLCHVYMIGDNPHGDIRGANTMRELGEEMKRKRIEEGKEDEHCTVTPEWYSMLVRTGMMSRFSNPPALTSPVQEYLEKSDIPTYECRDVTDCVIYVLEHHGNTELAEKYKEFIGEK
ncbi:HAD-superfamily hydrolase, subfamily IIA like protein [Aduncisulcus paluster]|uniref:HAD-superfamily hydrolase, subfamily IIA like protein n=1 Tax=Aduncisulcus paluster TaxID=2918883 RepID=A0ABQ5KIL3_9EUKA|nr:HAD-superfamily hydrolase, subfamily IIA like protein [Aduncisulcus paluster]